MSEERIDAERETTDATVGDAPTADLRTGDESSEKLDAAFELLAAPLRRAALYYLAEVGGERLGLGTLADAVAARDPSGDGAASGATSATWNDDEQVGDERIGDERADDEQADDERTDARSVAMELHHVHLPKLESHGVVAYDPEDRTVRFREQRWLTEWLEYVRSEECDARSEECE